MSNATVVKTFYVQETCTMQSILEGVPSFSGNSRVGGVTLSGIGTVWLLPASPPCPAWDYPTYRMQMNIGRSDLSFPNTHFT